MEDKSCRVIGVYENDGQVVGYELRVKLPDGTYDISVAKPSYLDHLRELNKTLESDLKYHDNMMPMEDITDTDLICKRVFDTPEDQRRPFLNFVNSIANFP